VTAAATMNTVEWAAQMPAKYRSGKWPAPSEVVLPEVWHFAM
jgi:hypothetical protein